MMAFFLSTFSVKAQTPVVFEEWAESKGVQEFFYKNVTVTDGSNNVYVAGATLNGDGNYDLLISKFDKYGVHLWSDTVAGAGEGHDMAAAIAIDPEGDILVCGTISEGGSAGNNMLLVKYDTDGFEYWRYSHDNAGNEDAAVALCIDSNKDIYLTGGTYNSTALSDMLTIKVDSYGDLVWEETYDYNNLYDLGVKIALSGSRVVVTGGGQYNFNSFVIVALSYMQSDGSLSGGTTIGGTQQTMEEVSDLFVDENNNVYIVGSKINSGYGYDFKTIKLDEDLDVVWVKEWDGDGLNDYARGVKVAPNGDVYVCGTSKTTDDGDDMVLISYSAGGNTNWIKTYNGNYRGDDRAETLEYHPDGYIYVAGSSFVVSNMDYLTLKYNTSGDLLWEINYNSPYNKNDRATNMAIDSDGDIIVTGQCERDSVLKTYYAVKYVEKDVLVSPINNLAADMYSFERNLGQIRNYSDSTINTEVLFYSENISNPVYFLNDRISIITHNYKGDTIAADTLDRFDIKIDKFNNSLKCRSFGKTQFYTNYFSGANAEAITRNHHYQHIYYENVWENADLTIHTKRKGQLSFQLLISPETSLSTFDFELDGIQGLTIDSLGMLEIQTTVQKIRFTQPIAYSISGNDTLTLNWQPTWGISSSSRPEISTSIETFSYIVEFQIYFQDNALACSEDYSINNCIWSTYAGAPANFFREYITNVSLDYNSNFYILIDNRKLLNTQFFYLNQLQPLEIIETQNNLANINYTQLVKFSSSNVPQWLSMYYGDRDTKPTSLIVKDDDIYFAGTTKSSNLYTINAHQTEYGSNLTEWEDGFVAKSTPDGNILWSTYIGGQGEELITAIDIDYQNRLFISGTHFPSQIGDNLNSQYLNGAYNHSLSATKQSFICAFENYNPIWLTYLGNTGGGSGSITINDLKVVNERLVVCGTAVYLLDIDDISSSGMNVPITSSSYFPLGAPSNAYYENVHGSGRVTGFLTEFDLSSLSVLWSTMIAGTSVNEDVPPSDNVLKIDGKFYGDYNYITALESTSATMNFMTNSGNFSGFYQDYNAAQNSGPFLSSVFILFKNREVEWGTYYGGIREEKIEHVLFDNDLNIFFSGYTPTPDTNPTECEITPIDGGLPICSSNNNYFIDPTYNHAFNDSYLDGFMGAFSFNHELIWSTHFGSSYTVGPFDIYESVSSLAFDPLTYELCVVGTTHGGCLPIQNFPGIGVYNVDTYLGGPTDGFIAKFDFSNLLLVTGTEESQHRLIINNYSIFPNPGNEMIFISSRINSTFSVNVYDTNGRRIHFSDAPKHNFMQLTTEHFSSGLYLIQIIDETSSQIIKWTKQ